MISQLEICLSFSFTGSPFRPMERYPYFFSTSIFSFLVAQHPPGKRKNG